MSFDLPPILKQAESLMLQIERAVREFPRYHKYAIGADLRAEMRQTVKLAHRAWRDRARQAEWTSKLALSIDDVKLSLQLSQQLRAFKSFAQFEMIAKLAHELGRQCGGWIKKQHSTRQNAQAPTASAQRPQILSSRGTSTEVRV